MTWRWNWTTFWIVVLLLAVTLLLIGLLPAVSSSYLDHRIELFGG